MAAERVAAEPVQWQVAPETAGEAGEDSDSREADDGDAGGYVMASFKQGKAMGDGLRLLHSQDALRWEALPPSGKPVLARPVGCDGRMGSRGRLCEAPLCRAMRAAAARLPAYTTKRATGASGRARDHTAV